jgi:hypothetical protein
MSRRSFFADTPYADTMDLLGWGCAALGSLAAIGPSLTLAVLHPVHG